MGSVRFTDLQTRPPAVVDLTSLTLKEFRPLVPPFEAAFQTHLAEWRLDGQPRTARRYTTDQHGPLPTPEERLLCILVYLQTSPLQVVQGRLFGMGQSQAHQWMHVLFVVLQGTRRPLGDAPTRSVTALAQRSGVAEATAAAVAAPPTTSTPPAAAPGSGLPGVPTRSGGHHHANPAAARPGSHARAERGASAPCAAARASRARQQPHQALSHRPRNQPPEEGGRPRACEGNLRCAA